eukprot:1106546-Pyramimonas_sp.AAC.1
MSELGLLAELGPQTYSYYSCPLDRRSRFSVLNSSYRTATSPPAVTKVDGLPPAPSSGALES